MSTKKYYGLEDLNKRYGPMTMAKLLRAWREADDMSQLEFAKKLKISNANLCDLEKGRKLVSPERAVNIAKVLGIPEEYLIQVSLQDLLRASNLNFAVEVSAHKKRSPTSGSGKAA